MEVQTKSDGISAAEMREREARAYPEAEGLHLVQTPKPPMLQIILGRKPESPYAVLRAAWAGVVWAMETRWYYQAYPGAKTLHGGWGDLPRVLKE